MRTEAEIRDMHDRLTRDNMIFGRDGDQPAVVALKWVLTRLVSDMEVFVTVELSEAEIDENDPDVADVLWALPLVVREGDLDEAKDYLARICDNTVADIAKAARRLDRLCKIETKNRITKKEAVAC